ELTVEGADAVADAPSVAAFRVLSESLTNVARHAQARRVDVTLRIAADRLALRVVDDGVGVAGGAIHAARSAGGGAGVVGMRERAESLGGELSVTSKPGAGTEVRLSLPLEHARVEEARP